MTDKRIWFEKHAPEMGAAYRAFAEAVKTGGTLDRRTKALLQVALACVLRCPHCVENNIRRALETGCSKAEVTEALMMAAYEAAGTQLSWVRETYDRYLGGD